MQYFINNPDIVHGEIKIAFTIDEEIGTGASSFDVEDFDADFAYTVDGSTLGGLDYETFNAAESLVKLNGISVHPGSAKDTMVNAGILALEFMSALPLAERPEHTEDREGFYLLTNSQTNIQDGELEIIIRDHDHDLFEAKKAKIDEIAKSMNDKYDYLVTSRYHKETIVNDDPDNVDGYKTWSIIDNKEFVK